MNKSAKEVGKAAAAGAGGAVVGAGTYGIIGGIGIAVGGTAIGVTLGPFIAVGSSLSLAGYGLYKAGTQTSKRER